MKGMVQAANRAVDLQIIGAWHTALFGLLGYAGKLKDKSLTDYLTNAKPKKRSTYVDAHAFFGRLKAKGVPIETRH